MAGSKIYRQQSCMDNDWFIYKIHPRQYFYNNSWHNEIGYMKEEESLRVYNQLIKKENEMKNESPDLFCVEVGNPIMSEALQKIAFENNFDWDCGNAPFEVKFTDRKFLLFNKNSHSVYNSDCGDDRYTLVNLNKCIELLQQKRPKIKKIQIGEYIVEYVPEGFKIGCKYIRISQVMELFASLERIKDGNEMDLGITIDAEESKYQVENSTIKQMIENWNTLYGDK